MTAALISFSLQVILDLCPAARNPHKEMKSQRRTLQNLVSLKGKPLSIVNESKLNHKGPLPSGQICQLKVKSYLQLTGCDGRKWYVVTIVETAALLLQSCLHDAQVVVNCKRPALRNIKLLVGSEGSGFLIYSMQNKSLLGTYSHILRTWAAERLATPLPTHRGQTLNLQHYSVFCSGHMEQSEIGIFLSKSWRPQLCDQTLCFSATATKGWA